MRVCHIVPSLEERHGGPSKSVRSLANYLARGGDEIDLLATNVPGDQSVAMVDEGASVRIFPRLFPHAIVRSPALHRFLSGTPFDCVHHHSLWLRTLHYAAEKSRHTHKPLVISPRGMMSGWAYKHHRLRKRWAARWLHPNALAQATGWHATSPQEADDIRALGFSQKICVAPNGVSLPSATELSEARAFWHRLCPVTAARPVALFYSRFHRKKRVQELIDLWLSALRGDWLLLIVGTAEEYSAAELTAEIARRGGAEKILVVDGAARPSPYAVASLFVLPSHTENFGLVIAEALAAGVPALVTDTTPWTGLSATGSGWCVSWEKFESTLTNALALAPKELSAMGGRGAAWVARDYSWEQAAHLLHQFYSELVHGSR